MKEIIITSSVLIICILLIRKFFRGKISSRLQYALWILVALRLVLPVTAQIYLSIGTFEEFRVVDLAEALEERIGSLTGWLEDPVSFRLRFHTEEQEPYQQPAAEGALGTTVIGGADGPTSIFLAGKLGFSWMDIFRGIWFGGMFVTAAWMIGVNILFCRRLHRERKEFALSEEAEAVLKEKLPEKMVRRISKIRKYTVEGLASPCLYGMAGTEAVYLTEEILEDTEQLCHVLTHELCHRKHGDTFWSLLRSVLVAVYWFHPLVWVAAVLSKRDCELACDEAALLLLGEEERIPYGETLLSVITQKSRLSDFACTATTMTGNAKSVKERISFIAKKPKELGIAAAVVLALVLVVLVLVFTKSPRFSGGTWTGGALTVTTAEMQIILPESIAGICGVASEEGNDDLIVYQVASGREVGRFRKVSFAEACMLVDEEKEVVPLGNYGMNGDLMRYMGLELSEETHYYYGDSSGYTEHNYTTNDNSITEDIYTPDDDSIAGVPGTDSNTENGVVPIPSPEESDHDAVHLPYEEGQSMAAQDIAEEQERKAESQDYPPAEKISEEQYEYLPDERITVTYTPIYTPILSYCYVYVRADYSDVKEKHLEEMEYINDTLRGTANSVIVHAINGEFTEELVEALAENKTKYLGENSAVGALVSALPAPAGCVYGGMELDTGEGVDYALQVNYDKKEGDVIVDSDMLFFDAVMLFATIENMEQCTFAIEDQSSITYYRPDLEEIFPDRLNGQDKETEEFKAHLRALYSDVVRYLDGKSS